MSSGAKKSDENTFKVIARNRRGTFDYEIEEKLECGIELRGTEVKVLRLRHASLDEAWASVDHGELWLNDMEIPLYTAASWTNHEPKRRRKLLAHRREIEKLAHKMDQKGKTLIPLQMYFDVNGRVKVTLAVASGKQLHDKRESMKKRDAERDIQRAMRR